MMEFEIVIKTVEKREEKQNNFVIFPAMFSKCMSRKITGSFGRVSVWLCF